MLGEFSSKIKRYFIAGLLTIVPVAITSYVVFLSVKGIYKLASFPTKTILENVGIIAPFSSILSFILTFFIVCAIGLFTTNIIGKRLIEGWENILRRVPLIRTIYTGVKELLQVIFSKKHSSFQRVVLVEFPRKGLWSIAFVTSQPSYMKEKTKKEVLTVFIPTTPNPTTGFFIIVPEKEVVPLDISVEEGIKLVVSGGILAPKRA